MGSRRRRLVSPVSALAMGLTVALLSGACGGPSDDDGSSSSGETSPSTTAQTVTQRYPDVIDVVVERTGDTYTFMVTISSPYDTPERYADGWRIKGEDGSVYGEHTLTHDHAGEQPFTRTQTGVQIPPGVSAVVVEGRDLRFGYGGETMTVTLP